MEKFSERKKNCLYANTYVKELCKSTTKFKIQNAKENIDFSYQQQNTEVHTIAPLVEKILYTIAINERIMRNKLKTNRINSNASMNSLILCHEAAKDVAIERDCRHCNFVLESVH